VHIHAYAYAHKHAAVQAHKKLIHMPSLDDKLVTPVTYSGLLTITSDYYWTAHINSYITLKVTHTEILQYFSLNTGTEMPVLKQTSLATTQNIVSVVLDNM
jgi:hypothetical protein